MPPVLANVILYILNTKAVSCCHLRLFYANTSFSFSNCFPSSVTYTYLPYKHFSSFQITLTPLVLGMCACTCACVCVVHGSVHVWMKSEVNFRQHPLLCSTLFSTSGSLIEPRPLHFSQTIQPGSDYLQALSVSASPMLGSTMPRFQLSPGDLNSSFHASRALEMFSILSFVPAPISSSILSLMAFSPCCFLP